MTFEEGIDYTARTIAELRASKEGQEGMASFLEKRKPNWVK
jgi:methylglutaconyl-CoA hydratase